MIWLDSLVLGFPSLVPVFVVWVFTARSEAMKRGKAPVGKKWRANKKESRTVISSPLWRDLYHLPE